MSARPVRRALAVGAFLALLLLASLLPSLFRGGGAPPTGRVRTAAGGPAPPGTVVLVRDAGGERRVRTGKDGSFWLEPVGGEAEYEARVGPLRAVAEARRGTVEIRLPPAFDAAGRVVTEEGDAVPDARVSCGGRVATTDGRGRFRLVQVPAPEGLPPPLEVAADGFRTLRTEPGADVPWDDLYLRLLRR